MIRLIIAEDEALERKALRSFVEAEFSKSIEVIAECATGRTFFETALELNPDLMLVDIEMPEMSGLEALNLLRENGLSGEALILTAYSEFDYARLAVKYQAADYLLKPVSRRDFSESIRNSMERIDKKKQTAPGRNQQSQERELIWRLRHPGPEFRTNLEELSAILKMKTTPFYFLSLPLAGRSGRPLLLSLKTRFDAMGYDCYGACISGAADLILQSRKGDINPEKIMKTLNNKIKNRVVVSEPLLLGPITDFRDLVREIAEKSVLKQDSAWVSDSLSRVSQERSLGDDLVEGRLHLIQGKLTNLFQYKKAVKSLGEAISYALELLTIIDRRLISLFATRFQSLNPDFLTLQLKNAHKIGEVIEILETLLCDVSRNIRQTHRTREQRLVEDIRTFLEEHSGDPPSMQEVSDHLKRSPSYISRCFRQVTGMSYKEFQIMHRMEMAKELLLTPGVTVAEVATATGFIDPNYFSKAFKRETGLSPRAYADGESYK